MTVALQIVEDELYAIHLRADFAGAILWSYSGGINEMEMGEACLGKEAADGVRSKIEEALSRHDIDGKIPDITLKLTALEAMCLAVAAENCATESLPMAQQKRLAEWRERWIIQYAYEKGL